MSQTGSLAPNLSLSCLGFGGGGWVWFTVGKLSALPQSLTSLVLFVEEREAALLPCRTIHLGFPLMQWLLLQAVPFLRTASPAATAPGEGRLMTSTSRGSTVQSAELAGMEGTA